MDNRIISIILSVFVAIVVVASVAIPIVSDALRVVEPITEYNDGTGHTYREARDGDVLTITSTYDTNTSSKTDVWTLNGKTVINPNLVDRFSWDIALWSDTMWVNATASSNASTGTILIFEVGGEPVYFGSNVSFTDMILSFTFTSNTIEISSNGGTTESYDGRVLNYSWAFVPCSIEDGGYRSSSVDSSNFKMTDVNDFVLCNSYRTGELDCIYYYYDGVLTTSAYNGSVETTATLIDGTYDIYNVSVTVSITDGTTTEEFSPYRALVPYEIHGHADNGAAHGLLLTIPALLIIAALVLTISLFVRRY